MQRRSKFDEIIIKGREQIQWLARSNPELRFKELVVPRLDRNELFLKGVTAHKVFKLDPELLFYIFYQSKPLPSGKSINSKEFELGEADKALLNDPHIADSLVAATLPRPEESLPSSPQVVLCLDRVIFPDNVGSLIRSASAISNVDAIIGTQGTCDFFGWKVLEASKARGFSVPTKNGMSNFDVISYAKQNNLLPIVGHSSIGVDPREIRLSDDHKGIMVIVGNEKHGPSSELLDISIRARIPISDRMNSLNVGVAGGILLQLASSVISP